MPKSVWLFHTTHLKPCVDSFAPVCRRRKSKGCVPTSTPFNSAAGEGWIGRGQFSDSAVRRPSSRMFLMPVREPDMRLLPARWAYAARSRQAGPALRHLNSCASTPSTSAWPWCGTSARRIQSMVLSRRSSTRRCCCRTRQQRGCGGAPRLVVQYRPECRMGLLVKRGTTVLTRNAKIAPLCPSKSQYH